MRRFRVKDISQYLLFGLLFSFASISIASAQSAANTLTLTIEGRDGAILRGSRRGKGVLLDFHQVDGLGLTPGRQGPVTFVPELSGAIYEASVDVVTNVPASVAARGQLSVTRSRVVSPKDLPTDSLYDAALTSSFKNLRNANKLNDLVPVVIEQSVDTGEQRFARKIGVFISTDLPAGPYEASILYTLVAP